MGYGGGMIPYPSDLTAAQRALIEPLLPAAKTHCGFCLPVCPTYVPWNEEMDSPRGRNRRRRSDHFDACLGCLARMTACPYGMDYAKPIEATPDQAMFIVSDAQSQKSDPFVLPATLTAVPYRTRWKN
jgi:Fe-S-cluster-containing dehydrogenase component